MTVHFPSLPFSSCVDISIVATGLLEEHIVNFVIVIGILMTL